MTTAFSDTTKFFRETVYRQDKHVFMSKGSLRVVIPRIVRNFGVRWTRPRFESGDMSVALRKICGKQRLIGFAFIDRDDFEIVARGF